MFVEMASRNEFIKLANSFQFRLYMLRKLPTAFFSGVRVKYLSETNCEVSVPFRWFSQNPFRSTYFACLAMAAELSTGALAMANVYKRKPEVSMLVVKMEAEFFKKATTRTTFLCTHGLAFSNTIDVAIQTGESQILEATVDGNNVAGELVARFKFIWSFKAKMSRS